MNYDIAIIDRLSGTTEGQRATNFRWLAQQGEQTKVEAIKLQTDLIRQQRQQQGGHTMSPEFGYAMHALAVQKMVWLETAQKRKGGRLSEEEFAKVQEIRIDRILAKKRRNKSSPKKDIIRVRFYHLIVKLREKELSWREIADYLGTHHKIKLAHSYLRESFNELTAERQKAGV